MSLSLIYTLKRPCADVASILILLNILDVVYKGEDCITVITFHIVVDIIRTQNHRRYYCGKDPYLLNSASLDTNFVTPALLFSGIAKHFLMHFTH